MACHKGHGSAGYWGAETTDCDTPLSLVNATLDWIAANVRDDIDFVIWTGDSARHDSDEDIPRHADEVVLMNRWMADRMAETFAKPGAAAGQLVIPVVPSMGNNDFLPHNIFYPGPNKWLATYLDIWRYFVPVEQHHSFTYGGWFSVDVVPDKLAVLSLNTMYFFGRNAGVDGCADADQPGYQHLEWLRIHLALLRERGMKAILIGHVPPARTENKQLWDESCWQKYTLWMRQYRDVVTASLYGHMNIDHFIVADANDIGDDLGGRHNVRKEVDFGLDSDADDKIDKVDSLPSDFSVASKGTYLAELRDGWSKLPHKISTKDIASTESKRHPHGGKWGERYSLAIVGPSVVPNYLPTLRIYEYNTTGMEDVPTWHDDPDKFDAKSLSAQQFSDDLDVVQDTTEESSSMDLKRRDVHVNVKKKKHQGGKKSHRPHDPKLIIPSPPSETAEPGPAYSPQPLTLAGYTQWFANLTRLNNMPANGVQRQDKPPKHLPFEYEVEYETFEDKWYRMPDLTVKSYVRLAARIARRAGDGKAMGEYDEGQDDDWCECGLEDTDCDFEDDVDIAQDEDEFMTDSNDLDSTSRKGQKHRSGGKKHKHRKKSNKLWLKFLSRAFVGAVPREELEQWDD